MIFEISDVDKAIDDVIAIYKKENLVNRRNNIFKGIRKCEYIRREEICLKKS